jgi:acyl carrier protein
MDEFLKAFAEQLDDTDAGMLTPETKFRDLEEWSSLTALAVIAMVDEVYNVTIKAEDIKNSKTIKDLYEIVKSRK